MSGQWVEHGSDGNCFFYSIYAALKNQNLLDNVKELFPGIGNNKTSFTKAFRNLIVEQSKTPGSGVDNSLEEYYNNLLESDDAFRVYEIQGWVNTLFNQCNKNNTPADIKNFKNKVLNAIKTTKNPVQQLECDCITVILKDLFNITVTIKNSLQQTDTCPNPPRNVDLNTHIYLCNYVPVAGNTGVGHYRPWIFNVSATSTARSSSPRTSARRSPSARRNSRASAGPRRITKRFSFEKDRQIFIEDYIRRITHPYVRAKVESSANKINLELTGEKLNIDGFHQRLLTDMNGFDQFVRSFNKPSTQQIHQHTGTIMVPKIYENFVKDWLHPELTSNVNIEIKPSSNSDMVSVTLKSSNQQTMERVVDIIRNNIRLYQGNQQRPPPRSQPSPPLSRRPDVSRRISRSPQRSQPSPPLSRRPVVSRRRSRSPQRSQSSARSGTSPNGVFPARSIKARMAALKKAGMKVSGNKKSHKRRHKPKKIP
jgi:hypothetical protein